MSCDVTNNLEEPERTEDQHYSDMVPDYEHIRQLEETIRRMEAVMRP